MKVEIVNDTDLDISYYISVDGSKKSFVESNNKRKSYEFHAHKDVDIQLYKDDIWKPKTLSNSIFLKLYMLDWTFGNLSEAGNLPFYIDYRTVLTNSEELPCRQILLSDIVKVEANSLAQWKKSSLFQFSSAAAVIALIGIILSFVFYGWTKLVFLACVLILTAFIWVAVNNKRMKLYGILTGFLQP